MQHFFDWLFYPALCLFALWLGLGAAAFADGFRFELKAETKQLVLTEDAKPVFVYQYDAVENPDVPKNDWRKLAGCFVHPLYGINGEVLTDNAPKDHYHHHGVFWTYPHVGVYEADGTMKEYDLWQGNKKPLLRQYFVAWKNQTVPTDPQNTEEPCSFEVENGWYIGEPEDGNKIMREFVKITTYPVKSDPKTEDAGEPVKSRCVDVELRWFPADKTISLQGAGGKSYGGLAVRLKPQKTEKQQNAVPSEINVITTSLGAATGDLPDTPLAWADYTSLFDGAKQRSGLAVFVPKDHPSYPPTWLTRYYGPLCVGYPGVNAKKFQPGEEIRLNYRLWIHNKPVSQERLEQEYKAY